MTRRKSLTIYLDEAAYEQLEAEARRLSTTASAVAQDYTYLGLANNDEPDTDRKRRIGLRALDDLAEITADLPPVDAVQVARESREELDERPHL
jgi:hypothetical protein